MRLSQEQQLKLEEAKATLAEAALVYGAVFNTPQGQMVLTDLEKQFGGSVIVPGDPYATHARAGSQEVLLYLKMMIEGVPNVPIDPQTAPQ